MLVSSCFAAPCLSRLVFSCLFLFLPLSSCLCCSHRRSSLLVLVHSFPPRLAFACLRRSLPALVGLLPSLSVPTYPCLSFPVSPHPFLSLLEPSHRPCLPVPVPACVFLPPLAFTCLLWSPPVLPLSAGLFLSSLVSSLFAGLFLYLRVTTGLNMFSPVPAGPLTSPVCPLLAPRRPESWPRVRTRARRPWFSTR